MVHTLAEPTARGPVSRVARLRAQAPLVPRPTGASGFEPYVRRDPSAVRVTLSTGAAGPIGGDHYELEVVVGAGSTLVLREVSATLVLPGPHGDTSRTLVRVRVEEGATFVWVPEPLIVAHRCSHEHDVRIDLSADSRLFVREELVLGRHGEPPGDLRAQLRVRREGAPLMAQSLQLGPGADGYAGAAVLGPHRGVGTAVVVEPDGHGIGAASTQDATATMPLDRTALQVSALGEDALQLRRRMDAALAGCGPAWGSPTADRWSAVPR
ncbi:urease accessory protein UreD [Ornithinimicrobium avium]|uniref:urease accessory protein UreD n=1 Tax=Ornithinimicrobium avium TaxID=2283195 RepID=UPI0013B3628D|nr:urease accessory protein UreD [Ornithinimicrobium avium]